MAVSQRMDLRQSQTLVMTPQLQQAIKLLELSNLELAAYVERELEQNPLLERADPDGEFRESDPAEDRESWDDRAPASAAETAGDEGALVDMAEYARADRISEGDHTSFDTDYDNMWDGDAPFVPAGGAQPTDWSGPRGAADGDDYGIEQTVAGQIKLRDHLLAQLGLDIADPTDRLIGLQLIDMIDDAGYVTGDLSQVAELLGCGVERVEATLKKLQRFDPPGIFARNLAECLALQLADRNRLDPAMQKLLRHLDLLASRDGAQLMKLCGVDAEDLAEMVAEIKSLNPKPGLAFDHAPLPPVTPDILMHRQPDGDWLVELNSESLPRVLVNNAYYARVSREARRKPERDYIVERFNSANWLVKSLHQRATTILKVATEIVRQQDAFFRHGVAHLKPLIRRDIAEAIGMHESTVSRVAANKYLLTPRGLYELRYFFSAAIADTGGGEGHAAEAVKSRIRGLIESETAERVLSDDQLVELLRKNGIEIARRTVAKYRESMRIPSSVQRRRDKALRM
ncbi:MAG: RNA polymerase sigma-54 factor [Alphaproteobacteria bacterium]|nr:MAG: RNA polymerase sigma-54 factor [Alphaproteobacteria bacterium]